MIRHAYRFPIAFAVLALTLAGCTSYTQTTSGTAYLQRYEAQARAAGSAAAMDPAIQASAEVEPLLRFPARLGLARIDDGRLSPIPSAEAQAWRDLADRLGADWGEFVPVSPLVTALASQPLTEDEARGYGCGYGACIEKTVRDIRLGAARQHVDAVLIYEVVANRRESSNPLAVTKLALIGYFLAPSESHEADGTAQAVLLDVRNGYTYGFATAMAEDAAATLSTSINNDEARAGVVDEAKTAAALKLTGEMETMVRTLRMQLAEARLKQAEAAAE